MQKTSTIKLDLSMDDVLEAMFSYVIENEVRSKPYISILSKRQLWFGNGPHFKSATDGYISAGLLKNAGMRIPSNAEIEKINRHYNYNALTGPWSELNNLTNRIMRTKILKNTVNNGSLLDIRVLLGRGYVRKDGTLDPDQTKGISVYIIFLSDDQYREKQNRWISRQAEWCRWQVARNQHTHFDILKEKEQSATAIVKLNRKLIKQVEWKQLEANVDRSKTPWQLED